MKYEIIIIGAGAAGLMAARELAKAGKKVLVLEARSRIGGRILPLDAGEYGYPAQGGAEWVHGEAPLTRALIKESGLTLETEVGEIWSARYGSLGRHAQFIQNNDELRQKLLAMKEDMSIADFLEQNFNEDKDAEFRNSIVRAVEGYDAADPRLMSTFTLRDEWLMDADWDDGRIKEGYTALLAFLEAECKKYDVEIILNAEVKKVERTGMSVAEAAVVSVCTADGVTHGASKVIVTVPLPVLKDIEFKPDIAEKLAVADRIGFGGAIKVLIKFKTRWWNTVLGQDLSKMSFLLCNEKFLTWWTQYPDVNTVLTGWLAGPEAVRYAGASSEEILDVALTSISNVAGLKKEELAREVAFSEVFNWPGDPFAKGAYSYTTIHTGDAYEKLAEPIDNAIFFAGEALFSGDSTSTVEGALGSGLETARKILL